MSSLTVRRVQQTLIVMRGAPSVLRVANKSSNTITVKPSGIRGPQGERGIQGAQGSRGEIGPAGPKGDPGDVTPTLQQLLADTRQAKSDAETALQTITASMNAVPTLTFDTPALVLSEQAGSTNVGLTVQRNGAYGDLRVLLGFAGTATNGTDYQSPPKSVTIPKSQNSTSFPLSIIDDAALEADEIISISASLSAYPFATATANIQIVDNDVYRPKAGDLVFGLSPYRTLGNGSTTVAYSPASGFLNETSDNFMTRQPEGWRTVYLNFGFNSADSAGPTALEVLPGNTNTIDYSVTFTGANGTGTRQQATFGGATSYTMANGGFAIEDSRPAFPGGFHRVSLTTPSGGKRPTGWNADTTFGEYRRRSSTTNLAAATSGTIPGSTPDNLRGYKPHGVLVPHDGATPSVLLIGDSITAQNDILPDARMLVGGIAKGLGSPVNGSFGLGNLGHHGAAMEDFMDVSTGSCRFSQRFALLKHIKDNLNGGRWPFTHIWSQGLRNDFSSFVSPTTPDEALVLMKQRALAWWTFLAQTFPGIPIIQSTISTRVTNAPGIDYTLLEPQEPRPFTAGVALEMWNEWLMTVPAPLAMSVDLRKGQRELRADSQFPGQAPVWARLDFAKSGGGRLSTPLLAGTPTSTIKIVASISPAVGSACYFEPGTSSSEIKGTISRVSNNGDGSFTCGLASPITLSFSHNDGAVFATAPSTDWTHPESVIHEIWAETVLSIKTKILSL